MVGTKNEIAKSTHRRFPFPTRQDVFIVGFGIPFLPNYLPMAICLTIS